MPLRLEIGPRDVAAGQARHRAPAGPGQGDVPLDAIAADLPGRLAGYQAALFQRALDFRAANTHVVDTLADLKARCSRGRRLPDGALVRIGRVRAAGQRGDGCDHPVHPVRLARRAGRLHRRWQAVRTNGCCSRAPTRRVHRAVSTEARPPSSDRLPPRSAARDRCYTAPTIVSGRLSNVGDPHVLSWPGPDLTLTTVRRGT